MGIVRAQTHRVRVIKGADRWSEKRGGAKGRREVEGE